MGTEPKIISPPKDVLRAIKRAYRAAKACSDAAADADAMVATYWDTDGVSLRPTRVDARHLRDAAEQVHSLAHTLFSVALAAKKI